MLFYSKSLVVFDNVFIQLIYRTQLRVTGREEKQRRRKIKTTDERQNEIKK